MYLAIQREDAYRRLASGLSGWHWEDEIASMCEPRNLPWRKAESGVMPHDCYVNGLKVQCKFTCEPEAVDIRSHAYKHGTRRYRIDDFDIMAIKLLFRGDKRFLFIPTSQLLDEKQSGYLKGRIRVKDHLPYLDNWNVFRQLVY